MRIVDAQIHLWGSGLPSNMAHRQVTSTSSLLRLVLTAVSPQDTSCTGYYEVPSLEGLWYRDMFPHDGSCAMLEDWFDRRRLKDDYVPTSFKGYGVKTRPVKGHPFGLHLSEDDKKGLIAFLRTI